MSATAGISRLLLELVVDKLISSMLPLPLEGLANEEFSVTQEDSVGEERRSLWAMCLVHRSWTGIARRGLWYRAVLRAESAMFWSLDINDANFSLIRELALVASESSSLPDNFLKLILRMPNLRKLYLDVDMDDPSGTLEILAHIRSCHRLECLWLVGDMGSSYEQILVTVASLPQLKGLVIDTASEVRIKLDGLHNYEPPQALRSVAVIDALEWPYFSWLIRPRKDNHISNLALSLDNIECLTADDDLLEDFYECLSLLQTLQISTGAMDIESERGVQEDDLGKLLSRAQTLREFTLSCCALWTRRLRLPNTLAVLHIHHDALSPSDGHASEWQENDRNIASVISESLGLREVILSFINWGQGTADEIMLRLENQEFPATRMACKQAGVTLKFKTYKSPYFGPLAENELFI